LLASLLEAMLKSFGAFEAFGAFELLEFGAGVGVTCA